MILHAKAYRIVLNAVLYGFSGMDVDIGNLNIYNIDIINIQSNYS